MARLVFIAATLLVGLPLAFAGDPSRRAAALERFEIREALGSRNGRPLLLKVITLGWAQLEVRTARAFLAMREAAARDGVELAVRSGFRDRATQAWLYRAWRAGRGNKAARPGYSSHESGLALDLDVSDARTRAWLRRHAGEFGFRATVRSEPWHWEYTPPPSRSEDVARR